MNIKVVSSTIIDFKPETVIFTAVVLANDFLVVAYHSF